MLAAKRLATQISLVEDYGGNGGGGGGSKSKSGMGLTVVHFRYYKPARFSALSQTQKTKLIQYHASCDTGNSKESGSNCGGPTKKRRGAGGGNKAGGSDSGSVASKAKNKTAESSHPGCSNYGEGDPTNVGGGAHSGCGG